MVKAIGGSPVALGWGEKFSVAESVLKTGREWSNGSLVQKVGAHTLVPITVVATSAIDAIAHALLLAGKTVGCAINTVLWICTGGKIHFSNSLTPSQLLTHAWKTAAFASFLVIGSAVAVGSSSAAFDFAKTLGLAEEVVVGGMKAFKDKMPKGYAPKDLWAKTDYVAREAWRGAGAAATWTWEKLRHQVWDRFAEHRIAQVAVVASVVLAYGLAAWKLEKGVAGPWSVGVGYAREQFTASWSVISSGGEYVKNRLGFGDTTSSEEQAKKLAAQIAKEQAEKLAKSRAEGWSGYVPQFFWNTCDRIWPDNVVVAG